MYSSISSAWPLIPVSKGLSSEIRQPGSGDSQWPWTEKVEHVLPRDDLFVQQELCDLDDVRLVLGQEFRRASVRILDHLVHGSIERLSRSLREWLLEPFPLLVSISVRNRSDFRVHTIVGANLECHLCDFLQIVLCTGGDDGEEDLLGYTTT